MGSKARRSSNKRKRPHARRKKRPSRPRKGLRYFLWMWVGVMLLAAAIWGGYRLWSERSVPSSTRPPQQVAKELPPETTEITLYFADDQAEYLVAERRKVPSKAKASAMAAAVLEALISGPRSNLQPTIPPGTHVREVSLREKGLCTVDLNEAFQKNHPGGTSGELMTVYSIVESLAVSVPGVRSVQILVEGKPRETLAGHLFIGKPLVPDPRYIQKSE